MVSALLKFLNRDVGSMNQAALLLGVFSLVSQLFGLVRDRLLASMVGPSAQLDVYYAAFRIPDFIYNSIAIFFSVTVILPFIAQYLHKRSTGEHGDGELHHFSNNLFSVYCLSMLGISVLAYFLMPVLTHITAPGFSAAQRHELVVFSRVMLLSPFLMGLSSLLSSFAQIRQKFFSFAIAPVFYNIGILVGIILFRMWWGMLGVVLGVVLGALLYFVIQLPTLISLHKIPSFVRRIDWHLMKQVVLMSLPRTLASSLSNLTFIVIGAMASLLVAGSISVFQLSYNIQTTPLMIIGISYAVAAFPMLSKLYTEAKESEYLEVLHRATRNIFFLSIPAALLIIVLRAQIVRVLLGAGSFSWNDTRLVAASLALFSISVTAQCMVLLLVRGFYAIGNTKIPLRINIYSFVITIISAGCLIGLHRWSSFFRDFIDDLLRIDGTRGASVVLLSLAYSIGQLVNAVLLWRALHKRIQSTRDQLRSMNHTLFHTLSAGIIAAASAYGTLLVISQGIEQEHFIGILLQGLVGGIVGVVMYAIVLFALKNEDITLFIATLKSKFWKQKPIVGGQLDL